MTFYQELQLNQAGSKDLLKKSETAKEKIYHLFVYMAKVAVTMAFCFLFVTIFSILLGNENSIVVSLSYYVLWYFEMPISESIPDSLPYFWLCFSQL